jgi:2-iminobutanoate/2-iminopropanoate deaminase
MAKAVVEVPVLSDLVRKLGVPLSLVTKANGMVYVSGSPLKSCPAATNPKT